MLEWAWPNRDTWQALSVQVKCIHRNSLSLSESLEPGEGSQGWELLLGDFCFSYKSSLHVSQCYGSSPWHDGRPVSFWGFLGMACFALPPHPCSCLSLFCLPSLVLPVFSIQCALREPKTTPQLLCPSCSWCRCGHIYTAHTPCPVCFHSLPQAFTVLLQSEQR